ncbi:MAG: integrase catalytic domain-containing protein [Bacteroidales bacterium]|nr:integrase catalytic domain-containing protein [Bacteroidales bacterium]
MPGLTGHLIVQSYKKTGEMQFLPCFHQRITRLFVGRRSDTLVVVRFVSGNAPGPVVLLVGTEADGVGAHPVAALGIGLTVDAVAPALEVEPATPVEERVRDLFLFSAFTGLAYVDIKNLREENVQRFFDGNWWILTRRHKTHLTFHVGRHTFATIALNRGMPVESLSRILGHTNIRATQIYARITNKKISQDMAVLAEGLSEVEQAIGRKM